MGMFDYVNFKMNCPKCEREIQSFQTKDGPRFLLMVEPDDVSRFYTSCKCGAWIEFNRPVKRAPVRDTPMTLEEVKSLGFEMTTGQEE